MSSHEEFEEKSAISDGCPAWAVSLIHKIYLLELESGNIKEPEDKGWFTTNQDRLLKIANGLDHSNSNRSDSDKNADEIFSHVAKGLLSENFNASEIVQFINSRIPTGTKLQYCSVEDIKP